MANTRCRVRLYEAMEQMLKRVAVVLAWVGAVAGWVIYQRSTGLGTIGTLESFIDLVRGQWWAFLLFVVVYAIRPVVLFPATLMTLAGGLLFGPVFGVAATVVGANASAMVAYYLARVFGFEIADDEESAGLLRRWSARMRRKSFETVFLMRLAFLPFDGVNYAAGLLRIRPLPFLLATAIGSLPGTISFTLAGASIESLSDGPSGIDPTVLIASVVLFIISLVVSRFVSSREESRVGPVDEDATEVDSVEELDRVAA